MAEFALRRYHLLKAALDLFQKRPDGLSADERAKAQALADKALAIETQILTAEEAAGVVTTDQAIDAARAEIEKRFDDREAFLIDLAAVELTEAELTDALRRQLTAEAVLEAVAERAPAPSDDDVARFYANNPQRFEKPEQRGLRHILITINDEYAENTRKAAETRIAAIYETVSADPSKFADEAQRISECPSALQGGDIGVLTRPQLHPPLADAVFALNPGEICAPVETEIGFHVALCESISPAKTVSLDEARSDLVRALHDAKREQVKRLWLRDRLMAGRAASNDQEKEDICAA